MILSDWGNIVTMEWLKSFDIRQELFCDEYIIMPNHLHAIVVLNQPNRDLNRTHELDGFRELDDSHGTDGFHETDGFHVETHGRASQNARATDKNRAIESNLPHDGIVR